MEGLLVSGSVSLTLHCQRVSVVEGFSLRFPMIYITTEHPFAKRNRLELGKIFIIHHPISYSQRQPNGNGCKRFPSYQACEVSASLSWNGLDAVIP